MNSSLRFTIRFLTAVVMLALLVSLSTAFLLGVAWGESVLVDWLGNSRRAAMEKAAAEEKARAAARPPRPKSDREVLDDLVRQTFRLRGEIRAVEDQITAVYHTEGVRLRYAGFHLTPEQGAELEALEAKKKLLQAEHDRVFRASLELSMKLP